jgi:hypothetical protein
MPFIFSSMVTIAVRCSPEEFTPASTVKHCRRVSVGRSSLDG